MQIPMAYRRVQRNLRDYGLALTLGKILNSFAKVLYYNRAYTLYRADLDQMTLPPLTDEAFLFRFLDPAEKKYVEQIAAMEEWLTHTLMEILQEGGQCLLALDGTQVAGFNLVSYQRIHLPVVSFTHSLRPYQAYSEQITVGRAYRGRNLGTLLRLKTFQALHRTGTKRIYGGTDINNRANLALCAKVGLKPVAIIRHRKLLGYQNIKIQRRR